MKNLFITNVYILYLLHVLFCSLNSVFDSHLLTIFFIFMVGCLFYIHFSAKPIVNGIKKIGGAIIGGALAAAGADLYQSGNKNH